MSDYAMRWRARSLRERLRYFDWLLISVVGALICVGLLFVYSTGSRHFAARQAMWLAVGLAAFAGALSVHYMTIVKWSYAFYAGLLLMLLAVLEFGPVINGSRRWLLLGPLRVQPSEFMKLAFILALSKWLVERRDPRWRWRSLGRPLALALLPMACILKQPDLGMTCVFVPILFAMLYAAGAPKRQLAALAAAGVLAAACAWPFLHAYQKNRLIAFIWPNKDPNGAGYQVMQSLIAVGSGGLTGSGWRQGMQNLLGRLPERHTDFIFPVIAEEWGFVGAGFTLLLYYALLRIGFSIAERTREPYGRYLVVGVAALFTTQILVNIGMTLGLAPVTGITLPFASYGGSSLLSSLLATGLVANVAMRRERVLTAEGYK